MKIEFKFRVWDKIRKQMIILDNLWLCCEYNSLCFRREEFKDSYDMWPLDMDEDLEHFEIMRYTGLKDKNKKDIYEGDICRDSEGYTYPIEWEDECALFSWDAITFAKGIPDDFEVVGNIYENTKDL